MKEKFWGTLLLVLVPCLSWAQKPQDSWENLRRLGVAEKIEVVDIKLKSLRGTFISFSEEAILLRVGNDEVAVQRGEVLRVTSRERTRRGKHALIGLAVGAAAGAAMGVAAVAGGLDESPGFVIATESLVFSGVGAGIGAAFPGYQTIYRAQKKPSPKVP